MRPLAAALAGTAIRASTALAGLVWWSGPLVGNARSFEIVGGSLLHVRTYDHDLVVEIVRP